MIMETAQVVFTVCLHYYMTFIYFVLR